MYDILSLLSVLHPHLSMTQVRQFSCVVFGMLAMTGRVRNRNKREVELSGTLKHIQNMLKDIAKAY